MIKKMLIAGVLAVATSFNALAGERQSMIDAFAKLTPSVAALYAHDPGGDFNFLCTATAVEHEKVNEKAHTVLITAQHCLKKGVAYAVNFGNGSFRAAWPWKIPHYEADSKSSRKYGEPETDMALFLIEGDDIPLVPVAKSSDIPPGTKVAMMGYPLGVAKISYEGIVAGTFDRPGADLDGYLLLQIFGAPGSSGSSVVTIGENGDMQVVSILVQAQSARAGLPVIFATPIEYRKYLSLARPESKSETK